MVPPPNQNLIENGATPTANYYRGGEPDKPVSSLYAGRIDYNMSARDRFFVRVRQHVHRAGQRLDATKCRVSRGCTSIDWARYNWA